MITKKISLIILCCAVLCACSGSAMADMYEMDDAIAALMRLLGVSTGDLGTLTYVGYNPGGPGDWVFGPQTEYGSGKGNMTYDVGFTGNLYDNDQSRYATVTIGLTNPGLSGTYDGFELPIANDDDDVWNYRAYVTTSGGTTYSNWTVGVDPGSNQTLSVSTPGLNYGGVTGIGFELQWDRLLNEGASGDDYNVSVVPVPGAVLLGMIGLSIVGVKLRRFA
jgi:hypothetical protein